MKEYSVLQKERVPHSHTLPRQYLGGVIIVNQAAGGQKSPSLSLAPLLCFWWFLQMLYLFLCEMYTSQIF